MATGTNGRKRVTFTIVAPEAREVFLCGCFNNWEPARTPMKKDASGVWKAQVLLPPGTYEYRLMIDGEWVDDPAAELRVPNSFGSSNCVREVRAKVA